ncbi:demethoxyubiquinone hydroxylase family protein, partial [Xanthomonas perforans]
MAVGSTAGRGPNRRVTPIPPTRLHSPLHRLPVETQRAPDTAFRHPPAQRPHPPSPTPYAALHPVP